MALKVTVSDNGIVLYQSDPTTFTEIGALLRNVTNAIEGGSERAQAMRERYRGCVCAAAENHSGKCLGEDCYCHG